MVTAVTVTALKDRSSLEYNYWQFTHHQQKTGLSKMSNRNNTPRVTKITFGVFEITFGVFFFVFF